MPASTQPPTCSILFRRAATFKYLVASAPIFFAVSAPRLAQEDRPNVTIENMLEKTAHTCSEITLKHVQRSFAAAAPQFAHLCTTPVVSFTSGTWLQQTGPTP